MQETQVWSLGWENPLEKGMAAHSSILAWRIPSTEPGNLQSLGLQRVGHDWATNTFFHIFFLWNSYLLPENLMEIVLHFDNWIYTQIEWIYEKEYCLYRYGTI